MQRECAFTLLKMDKYELKKEIGSGQFGIVYQYYDHEEQRDVAVKVIQIFNEFDGFPSRILREISILRELNHNGIVKLLDVIIDGCTLYLVFEFLDCDLADFIMEEKPDLNLIKRIMYEILSGLCYLHSNKVIHRDFCPSNILVDKKTLKVKIADFGLARYIDEPAEAYTHTECTYEYTAPEQLLRAPTYSTPVDIWAAGCIFAEMVREGQQLFWNNRELCSIAHIERILGVPDETTWPHLSCFAPTLHSVASSTPQGLKSQVERLDSVGLDLLSKMLLWDPNQRITAYEALQHRYFCDLL
ncbi:cell division control protein 2 [Tripterygium wilfordii]|uniref:cyclin-dependent kinase n=2 Tax=Tripterygium wilfordii TaxID=458696 RepID=A0A7J7DMR3_TRIWF|nr:cell division control protein 2 [Tripterygium wilfordii]KAF5747509.1 cell division control protein 2 [Tripterygium wilfordii]